MNTRGEPAALEPRSRRDPKRIIGSLVGVALFVGAVAFAFRGGAEPVQVLQALRAAPPWLVLLLVALPVANWVLISLSFWFPMSRLGRIALGEMLAVIGAAWLLNYLPLRPGLLGRIAYHKAVNQISVRGSVAVSILGLVLGAVGVAYTLLAAALMPQDAMPGAWLGVLGLPLIASLISVPLAGAGRSWLALAFLFRYADLLVWIARYAVVFHLSDLEIGLPQATAFAAVSQLAVAIPLVGNGLGLREWGIGLVAANWPLPLTAAAIAMPQAITADLLNRAAEVLVAVPVGLAGTLWLARNRKR